MTAITNDTALAEQSLVRPVVGPNTPKLGPFAVIAGVLPDMQRIARAVTDGGLPGRPLYLGQLLADIGPAKSALAGPVLGAPQAVMTLESLHAWGVRSVLFWGWCGAIAEGVDVGDILCAAGAWCDEGTSRHYGGATGQMAPATAVRPAPSVILDGLTAGGVAVTPATVWTTDAIFRETPSRVAAFRARGAVAVDMETSALLAAAAHLGMEICCLLAVSDVLRDDGWQKGFKSPVFRENRRRVCRLIAESFAAADEVP